MEGLFKDFPNILNRASKWIREFDEKTQGKKLAVGDIKAILARMIEQDETTRITRASHYQLWNVNTADFDAVEFDPYRNGIWTELRDEHPIRRDLGQLQGETISDTEHPGAYYQRMKKNTKLEPDESPDDNILPCF